LGKFGSLPSGKPKERKGFKLMGPQFWDYFKNLGQRGSEKGSGFKNPQMERPLIFNVQKKISRLGPWGKKPGV